MAAFTLRTKLKRSILFACGDNAGLSLIAEAVTNHTQPMLRAFSAGVRPSGPVDLAAVECLHAARIPADGLSTKPIELFAMIGAPRVDGVISLVGEADEGLHGEVERMAQRCRSLLLQRWPLDSVSRVSDIHERRLAYRKLLPRLHEAIGALATEADQAFAA